MRKAWLTVGLVFGAVLGGPAHAQQMQVAEFLVKADALQAKGPMALFSKDVGRLKAEVQAAGRQVRAEQAADLKAGRKPATCLPPEGKAAVTSDQLLAYFRAIPPSQRTMFVKQAFAGLARKHYPCPA